MGYIVAAILGYLLGSIPTGFLYGKARGVDIRAVGSRNIGATNVLRSFGRTAGGLVLFGDALKGFLAVAAAEKLLDRWFGAAGDAQAFGIVAGIAAILGHNFTCWLHFKGGKGIATSAGVLVALVPFALLIGLGTWIVVFALSRYVSLASILAAAVLPVAVWFTKRPAGALVYVTAALAALAIYKHRANIKRLLSGTESRFSKRVK